MDKTTQKSSNVDVKSFKKRFFHWAQQWIAIEEHDRTLKQENDALDAASLGRLLQVIGYRLRTVNHFLPREMTPVPGVTEGHTGCRVIIECPRTQTRYEFDGSSSVCKCRTLEAAGHSSMIIGREPNGQMEGRRNSLSSLFGMDGELSVTVGEVVAAAFLISESNSASPSLSTSNRSINSAGVKTPDSDGNVLKTPAANITIITPGAPVVPKSSPEFNSSISSRCRSLDTLITIDDGASEFPVPAKLAPKNETTMDVDESGTDAIKVEMKYISPSSPVVCPEFEQIASIEASVIVGEAEGRNATKSQGEFPRSDTLVSDDLDITLEDEPRIGPPPSRSPDLSIISFQRKDQIVRSLREAQTIVQNTFDKAIDMITHGRSQAPVNDKFLPIPEDNIKSIRRLSDIGCFPRTATCRRSTASRLSSLRRSTTIAPTTPTSSRASATLATSGLPLPSPVIRVKSTSAANLRNPAESRLTLYPVRCRNGASGLIKSPVLRAPCSSSNTSNLASNQKHAHAKSSIPKVVRMKKG